MKKTQKVIVILNGERVGLLENSAYEIGHYMANIHEVNELQFKQTDGQTLFKSQFNQIREVADPTWLYEELSPLIEQLAKNKKFIEDIVLQPLGQYQ